MSPEIYAPEIDKRIRQHLKMSGTSYCVDETYFKVGKSCKYLYRDVYKEGQTIDFLLSPISNSADILKCLMTALKSMNMKLQSARV